MQSKKALALVATMLVGLGAACSDTDDAAVSHTTAAVTAETDDETGDDATDDAATDSSLQETAAVAGGRGPGGVGAGGAVEAESVSSVDELIALIEEAYGDASLGLHRGHQPVESILIEVLGISHDEMHVRMETQGQNLGAIASDLGIDPQTLIDALVDSWSPAIDGLLEAGTITEDEADAYRAALEEAFTYRVTWNGTDATPTFTGI
jgi:hypothetical protein